MASRGPRSGGASGSDVARTTGAITSPSGTIAPELIVTPDPVARAATLLVARLDALAAEAAPLIRLAISGGSALDLVLRAAPQCGALWQRVALTWVDERCVPLADPASNRGEAMRRGLPLPRRIVPLLEDGETPEAAIARFELCYSNELVGGLDLVVLGMGPDGHVASLFPGRPWPQSGTVAFVPDSPKPPERRLTLTRTTLARARHTLLLVAGESKRGALERLLDGDPALPATGLPGLVVVTDLEHATKVSPASDRRD